MIKSWASWVVKIALTVGSVWYLQTKVDVRAAWTAASKLSPSMFAAAVLLLLVQVGLCTLRWQVVLKVLGAALSFAKACELFWMGNFFGLVLPGAVGGDAIRIWKTRRAGLSLSVSVNSVMLERIATVFGLVLLVTISQPLLAGRLSDTSSLWVFPALTVLSVVGIVLLMLLDRFPSSIRHWQVIRAFNQLAHDTRLLFLRPIPAILTMVIVIVGHINLALGVYVLAVGLGAPVTAIDCLVLVPPVILIATLPISIAGWGAREVAMVTVFGFIGVSAAQATAMSVLFGVVTTLTALPGGVIWLFSKDRREMSAVPPGAIPDA